MRIRNKKTGAEYSSSTLIDNSKYGDYYDEEIGVFSGYHDEEIVPLDFVGDDWEQVKELSEEEKLNQLRHILLEWNYEDIVDKIIDEYKKKIQYDND